MERKWIFCFFIVGLKKRLCCWRARQSKSELNICWLPRIIRRWIYWMQMKWALCWSRLYKLSSVCLCCCTTLNDAPPLDLMLKARWDSPSICALKLTAIYIFKLKKSLPPSLPPDNCVVYLLRLIPTNWLCLQEDYSERKKKQFARRIFFDNGANACKSACMSVFQLKEHKSERNVSFLLQEMLVFSWSTRKKGEKKQTRINHTGSPGTGESNQGGDNNLRVGETQEAKHDGTTQQKEVAQDQLKNLVVN